MEEEERREEREEQLEGLQIAREKREDLTVSAADPRRHSTNLPNFHSNNESKPHGEQATTRHSSPATRLLEPAREKLKN